MRKFLRLPKRSVIKVKADIESTTKIVREDIYDILKASWKAGKTKEEAAQDLASFIEGLSKTSLEEYLKAHRRIEEIVRRIVSDIDSYGLDWTAKERK